MARRQVVRSTEGDSIGMMFARSHAGCRRNARGMERMPFARVPERSARRDSTRGGLPRAVVFRAALTVRGVRLYGDV